VNAVSTSENQKNDGDPKTLHGSAAEALGGINARGVGAMEDSVLYLWLDAVVLGGGRNPVESGFEGEADDDALREMWAGAHGGGGEGLMVAVVRLREHACGVVFGCGTDIG
jgi:hypothetical protein